MTDDIKTILSDSCRFLTALNNGFLHPVPSCIQTIGNLEILDRRLLGFFCSAQCSGNVILRTYDLIQALRNAGMSVIGGFHTPMEKECLDLLLRGPQPIVVCPARSVQRMRLASSWRRALDQERLLIVSPFEARYRRVTAELAERRNRLVATLSSEILVAHAGPQTKTERLGTELLDRGIAVHAIDLPDNAHLIERSAVPIRLDLGSTIAQRLQHGVISCSI
jgi:predicted Rossmann fold nucleotide-binding protein DprA/Smf involved in DNA uptake